MLSFLQHASVVRVVQRRMVNAQINKMRIINFQVTYKEWAETKHS